MDRYRQPMQPWPGLAKYARTVDLPRNAISLYLYEAGAGGAQPILLLHGLGDEADTWRHLVEPLAERGRVIAPDLPGFGRSDKPQRAYTLPFLRDCILELMDTLAIDQATLIGSSLGAILAQTILLEHPERVRSLVLVDGTVVTNAQRLDRKTLFFLIPGLGEWLYNRLRKDPQAAYDTLYPYYANLDGLPAAEREFLFQRVNQRVWSDGQRRAYFSVMRNMVRATSRNQGALQAQLSNFDTPTLVAWGESDQIFLIENARTLVEIQPSSRLVTVPGAGHLPQQEQPQALLDMILEDERLRI